MIELATGRQCVLFGFSDDLTRATVGAVGEEQGGLWETDVWGLVPHCETTGDSCRPASSRWVQDDGFGHDWLLVHKGYVNSSRYGHLRSHAHVGA